MPFSRPLAGALAGFVATAPMTVAMQAMHRFLPWRERYPLPPGQITRKATALVGLRKYMGKEERVAATVASHFAYGAMAGALYAPLAQRTRLHPTLGGIIYGLIVWAASYVGLMPALGVLSPVAEHPARRTILMIAAHLVWGSVTGLLFERFRRTP